MNEKKAESNDKSSRRIFVKLGLVSGALAAIGKVVSSKTELKPKGSAGEKVKMLTPDGKLVEVDQRVIEAASKKKKATNAEIHDFVDYHKTRKA